MCGGAYPSKGAMDYQAEDDHRTLGRAAEIEGDSKRMAGVKKHHAKTTKAHKAIGRAISRKR